MTEKLSSTWKNVGAAASGRLKNSSIKQHGYEKLQNSPPLSPSKLPNLNTNTDIDPSNSSKIPILTKMEIIEKQSEKQTEKEDIFRPKIVTIDVKIKLKFFFNLIYFYRKFLMKILFHH